MRSFEHIYTKNIPEVKITTLAERIEDAITEEDINFEDYNLIISAAGNHNLNRWINSWIQNNKSKCRLFICGMKYMVLEIMLHI